MHTPDTTVVTFYSYKGGVGRTMALLNVAYGLAHLGRNVLVVDLDLEAPGLSTFLNEQRELETAAPFDSVDFLSWGLRTLDETPEDEPSSLVPERLPALSDFACKVVPEKVGTGHRVVGPVGQMHAIVCHEKRDYVGRLERLRLRELDGQDLRKLGNLLASYFRCPVIDKVLPEYYGQEDPTPVPFDYVLVDSRTGLNEIGGLCVGPLADMLVIVLGLNNQNIQGTQQFLETIGIETANTTTLQPDTRRALGPKPTLLVASPVPNSDAELRSMRLKLVLEEIGPIATQLTYHPRQALVESLIIRDFPDEHLAREYWTLVGAILVQTGDDFDRLMRDASIAWFEERNATKAVTLILRALPSSASEAINFVLKQISDGFTPRTDEDFIASDGLHRALADIPGEEAVGLRKWSLTLLHWALVTPAGRLRDVRFERSLEKCEQGLAVAPESGDDRASLFLTQAIIFENMQRLSSSAEAIVQSLETPKVSTATHLGALVAKGRIFVKLERHEEALSALEAVVAKLESASEAERQLWDGQRAWRGAETREFYTTAIAEAQARLELANLYLLQGEIGNAGAQMDKLPPLSELPESLRDHAHLTTAVVAARQGSVNRVVPALLAASKAGVEQRRIGGVGHWLILSLIRENKLTLAIDLARRLVRGFKDLVGLEVSLGIALLANGQHADATALCSRVARDMKDISAIDQVLGVFEDAAKTLKVAVPEEIISRFQAKRQELTGS
jgi:tetratricopeptide (TPR) repeat protein